MKHIIRTSVALVIALMTLSCTDFLNRPSEDSYTTEQYYTNDTQCEQGVNYLYNSPWYDIIRFYIYGSETMCGNVYQGQSAYNTLTVNVNRLRSTLAGIGARDLLHTKRGLGYYIQIGEGLA